MRLQIVRDGTLIGSRTYRQGEFVELDDALGRKHLNKKSAILAPEDLEDDLEDGYHETAEWLPAESAEAGIEPEIPAATPAPDRRRRQKRGR